jgi:hypothetical protein
LAKTPIISAQTNESIIGACCDPVPCSLNFINAGILLFLSGYCLNPPESPDGHLSSIRLLDISTMFLFTSQQPAGAGHVQKVYPLFAGGYFFRTMLFRSS